MTRKINKNIIIYAVFAILGLIFFLYARFPARVVENYILANLSERYPNVFLSFQSVSLSFPPGLKLENLVFGFKDNVEANVKAERIKVRPRLSGYISGGSSFLINVLAYEGAVKGVVNFPDFIPEKSPASAEVRFEGLNLEKISYVKDKLGRRITGKLGGAFTYGSDSKIVFNVQSGTYQLLENLFGFDKLDFNSVEGQISLKGGVLKIEKLRLKGDKIACSLKGDILLKPDLNNSEINLSGTMEIVALNKKISMMITGTLGNVKTRYI